MTDYKPSIVEYYSKEQKNCGYCSSSNRSYSYGLHAYTLRVEDYQDMIDRGWRRCGKYCYKSVMDASCCPLYTIRCAVKDFKLSKTQKKILKRFNNFLLNGTVTNMKIHRTTEIVQPMDTCVNDERRITIKDNLSITPLSVNKSVEKTIGAEKKQPIGPAKPNDKPIGIVPPTVLNVTESSNKNKCMKAKQLRIERKRQKLQKLGLSEEEINKKLVEKKKYPVVKTIEDFINESSLKNAVHNLKICLVRACPRSEEFMNTFPVAFDLYKRYQMFIHKDNPEKLNPNQFDRVFVNSPLQIKLVSVESPEFKKSFKETALLFAKYQRVIHHESIKDCDSVAFKSVLVNSPFEAVEGYGSYHQQYWLDDKLIAVGVIDILPKCVSSVYFFYDPEYSFLSLGTYGALREIEFTRKLSGRFPDLKYYYMGFYIHSCVKMKYKGAFKPSYLLCPEVYSWHLIQECLPKLEVAKYSRFNEDPTAYDVNSNILISDVLILYNRVVMSFEYYFKKNNCDSKEYEEIMEYAKLIGNLCAKRMVLVKG